MSEKSAEIPAEIASLSFEDALMRLEEIVKRLEDGQVSLEDSIEVYETGQHLKRHCETKLASAKARIEQIQVGTDGQAEGVEAFSADAR